VHLDKVVRIQLEEFPGFLVRQPVEALSDTIMSRDDLEERAMSCLVESPMGVGEFVTMVSARNFGRGVSVVGDAFNDSLHRTNVSTVPRGDQQVGGEMRRHQILIDIRQSLAAITVPRFYETERGFQGELLVQLGKRLVLPDQAIIEQEHQKRALAHGLTCRPDIIIHEPFDESRHKDRSEGNFVAIELKLRANMREASDDFQSLSDMIQKLGYPLGIFINIGSNETYRHLVSENAQSQIVTFAVALRDGEAQIVT
jgi:hypothetical protein